MLSVLTILSMLALEAGAFWRLPCRQALTIERVDPLTDFGRVGQHVHTVHGGNGFSASASNSDLMQSTCTSCQVLQDRSAYWTPVMYFEDTSGNFNIVNQTGGMLAYYFLRGDNVTAFPKDFRMIAGDPRLRSFPYPIKPTSDWVASDMTEDALRQKAVGFNCLNYAEPANAALGLQALPDNMATNCVDGLRAEVFFPSCWNGKDLDSANHRDHMRYPNLMSDGTCPDGFETRLVSLFFETIWNVHVFDGQEGRFVFSTGDPLGYGYHGDFMSAWDVPVLKSAIANCTSLSGLIEDCAVFDLQSEDDMHKCTIPSSVNENVSGPLKELPGCNLVNSGPAPAPPGGCSTDGSLTRSGSNSTPTFTASSGTTSSKATATPPPAQSPQSSRPTRSSQASRPSQSPQSGGANQGSYDGSDDSYNLDAGSSVAHAANDEPSAADADPNLVIVTVTSYTTVPGTTITIHTTPTPPSKRQAHKRRGHKNH